jgi:hypothetical protein
MKAEIPRPNRPPSDSSSHGVGFAARLDGASLADLVQIECMRGTKRVIRVTSEGRFGYLYFDQGQVVHATTAGRFGENAALTILSWKTGTFEACEHAWPVRASIHVPHQSLVMRAAQQEDEARRNTAPEANGPSESGISRVPAAVREVPPANEVRGGDAAPELEEQAMATNGAGSVKPKNGVLRAVRLDREGNVLSHVGPALGDFADAASYTLRLCSLIGESLGLEDFVGLECGATENTFLAFWDKETIVAMEVPVSADIETYKKRAGL